jgi:hypothetical protein
VGKVAAYVLSRNLGRGFFKPATEGLIVINIGGTGSGAVFSGLEFYFEFFTPLGRKIFFNRSRGRWEFLKGRFYGALGDGL